MLYEVLKAYRQYLCGKYSKETARVYTIRLCTLFQGQSLIDTIGNFDIDKVLSNLATIQHKNYFSQTKNAFLKFCEFEKIKLSLDVLDRIEEIEKGMHKKYRKQITIDYQEVKEKINHLKNAKLKLCYQTLVATGLRVSELASITAGDCLITDEDITFTFIGKGGNSKKVEKVSLKFDEYPALFQRIKEQVQKFSKDSKDSKGKKVFYSAIYLETHATKLGFTCHDLRRACAKLEYQKTHSKVAVMKKLRHTDMKNTNIYLRSRVLV